MRSFVIAVAVAACWCSACGSHEEAAAVAAPPVAAAPATRGAPPRATAATSPDRKPRVVVLGDSLTAGLGLSADEAYPQLLQQRLNDEGLRYEVINAGVSGDTSAGGLSRLDWALDGDVRVLIVALGGNDALRGLPVQELTHNLSEIIRRAQERQIAVVLAGMEAPPNYGRDYTLAFHQVYPALAKQYHVPLVPFLLQGVGGIERLNQRDGIHPTAEGARILATNVWTVLKPIVEPHG
jgi:acyl-CoA thioesterase I